jgi:hypothetical protein
VTSEKAAEQKAQLLRLLGACVRSKERRDRGQAPAEASADMPHAVMQVCLPACLAAWHVAFFFSRAHSCCQVGGMARNVLVLRTEEVNMSASSKS